MNIYIGADHRGFQLKEKLKMQLIEEKHDVVDLGNYFYDENDDYSIFAKRVGEHVSGDIKRNQLFSRGIVLCGSGAGVDIVTNKIDGVRTVTAISAEQVHAARKDDDVNILALAADYILENEIPNIVDEFLKTPFDGLDKHKRRIEDIRDIEEQN